MSPETLDNLAEAIAHEEGFGPPENRPTRNNNPGDLRGEPGTWLGQAGTDAGGFCVFADVEHGRRALRIDLANHAQRYPQQTLGVFIAGDGKGWPGYAPASDANDSAGYAHALAAALGVTVDTRFADLP